MTQFAFSTQGIDTENRFEALPPGEYTVMVTNSEIKTTQAGTGRYISLEFEVQAPEAFRGRKLWDNMNIENPSAKAVEIAQRQLAQLVQSCGLQEIQDTTQLHHTPVIALVKIDKGDNTRNQIKGYKATGSSAAAHPAPVGGSQAQPSSPQPPIQHSAPPSHVAAPPQGAPVQQQRPPMPWMNQ
jgi:hypothetical protein